MKNSKLRAVISLLIFLTLSLKHSAHGQFAYTPNKLFQNTNKVLVAAHRGNWKEYPENSIPAIQSCIGKGIDIIEIDVQQTKDGHFVLMHDASIDRTTTGKGKVSDYTVKELQRFKLRGKGDSITEYRIPTLDTILKITKDKILLNIDKSSGRFNELTTIIDSLDCDQHVLLKGNGSGTFFKRLNNQDTTSIYYMPILSTRSKIDSFLIMFQPPLFEFTLTNDTSIFLSSIYLDYFKKMKIKLWYNALFNSISGGHTESVDAINSWNWFIAHDAFVIQTDYPFHLVKYLGELGLHEKFGLNEQYDLSLLPVADTITNEKIFNSTKAIKKQSNYHIVKAKETLYSISKKNNISLNTIYQLNPGLKKRNKIKLGQKIRVH